MLEVLTKPVQEMQLIVTVWILHGEFVAFPKTAECM